MNRKKKEEEEEVVEKKKPERERERTDKTCCHQNTCAANRIEWKEHRKMHKSISILKLANKKLFLSLSFSLYSHQKYIKKTSKRIATIAAFIRILNAHTHTHNFNVSVLWTWCPPTWKWERTRKRNKRANKSIEELRKMKSNHTYEFYTQTRPTREENKAVLKNKLNHTHAFDANVLSLKLISSNADRHRFFFLLFDFNWRMQIVYHYCRSACHTF